MDYQIRQDNLPYKNETNVIINAAIEVHKALGCGFLEIVYKDALCIELESRGYYYERESNIRYIIKIFCCHIVSMRISLYLIR
ncbi:GxxExxY protein [Pedobacter agri]|nr:GxxExxY protein [Pedobacter agri]MDQ1139888.1 GxxExxY protein [Pedobacter agri]